MDRLTIKEAISFCKQGKEVILRNDDYEDLVLVDYEDGYLKDIAGDYINPYKDLLKGDYFIKKSYLKDNRSNKQPHKKIFAI